jgi:hypothetical protein
MVFELPGTGGQEKVECPFYSGWANSAGEGIDLPGRRSQTSPFVGYAYGGNIKQTLSSRFMMTHDRLTAALAYLLLSPLAAARSSSV